MPNEKDYSKPEIKEDVPGKELDFGKIEVNQGEQRDLPGKERDYTSMLKLFGKTEERINQGQIKNNNDNNDNNNDKNDKDDNNKSSPSI